MRLVYLGTPDMAVPPLEALLEAGHDVALVITGIDKRRGRGSETSPSPVKSASIRLGVPVFPGHTLTYTGTVSGVSRTGDEGFVDIEFAAVDELGEHVSGTATLGLPLGVAD